MDLFLQEFQNFLSVMGMRPPGKSLRRIDPKKPYELGNLKWGPEWKRRPRSCVIGSRHREHNSWKNMMVRTYYPSHAQHKHYVEIGCYVEKFLQDFENFYSFMGPRPEGKTLDRIDPWGAYTRSNIRWATPAEQNRNTRRNHPKKAARKSLRASPTGKSKCSPPRSPRRAKCLSNFPGS